MIAMRKLGIAGVIAESFLRYWRGEILWVFHKYPARGF